MEEINDEVPEPAKYYQESMDLSLKVMAAPKNKMEVNIFKDAQFWFSKGHNIQLKSAKCQTDDSKKDNSDTVALDYYLSGVKIDPSHIGCIYNVGCCQYFTSKFANADKWFSLAIKVDPSHQDSYIGKTMACLKLNKYEQALESIAKVHAMAEWTSVEYKREQAIFLYATTARILEKWDLMFRLYKEMKEGSRLRANFKVSNQTCGLLLLPLEKSRQEIENAIENFIELVLFNDIDQFVDPTIPLNLKRIATKMPALSDEFLANFLLSFPFFQRAKVA